ncbi:hypothetical protein QQZ08_010679 [Neonectria magnoliae]|uniref:Metallo-beta-lactamase domain-containing protein n=1 Tax=Neonectria magnoliae TaxID=2732573 RepID=A0ABR1HFD6_9HYPO
MLSVMVATADLAFFYFSGDTILVPDEVANIREKYHVVIVIASLGQAFIPYPTPDSDLIHQLDANLLIPMHYESWSHFTEGRKEPKKVFKEKGILNKVILTAPVQKKVA